MRQTRAELVQALFAYDASYLTGTVVLAGMDEAGRGPLCGNVVAACVVMPRDRDPILWVDDSKKLSEARRESVYAAIRETALYVGIGEATPEEIARVNILEATKNAMRRAAAQVPADLYLIDALQGLGLSGREIGIIHGDALSYSIAAASIVAKVTRDREMQEADLLYPGYGLARNKGYGTAEHIAALKANGPCPIHRRSFIGHFVD